MTGGILTVIRRCLFNSLWFQRELSQYKTLSEKIYHARRIIHKTYEFTIKEHKMIFPNGKVISSTLEEVLTRHSHHVI